MLTKENALSGVGISGKRGRAIVYTSRLVMLTLSPEVIGGRSCP